MFDLKLIHLLVCIAGNGSPVLEEAKLILVHSEASKGEGVVGRHRHEVWDNISLTAFGNQQISEDKFKRRLITIRGREERKREKEEGRAVGGE